MKDKQNVLYTVSKKYYPLAGGSSQVKGQSVLFSNKTKQPKEKKKPLQSQKGKYCIIPLI